jgi:small subunit ribosomal protein S7
MVQKKVIKFKTLSLYDKFIGFLIKKGKKTIAKRILEDTFYLLSKRMKTAKNIIFLRLFLKLNTFVEIKKVQIRKRSFFVPFSITLKRRSYLVIKWLLQSVKEKKEKVSISQKLAEEIFEVLTKTKSKTSSLKKFNNNQAFLNRSNYHFRW